MRKILGLVFLMTLVGFSVILIIIGGYELKWARDDERMRELAKEPYCIYVDEDFNKPSLKTLINEGYSVIYLTFDDGPSEYTAELLDVLAKYNVKATFFVTGYGDDAMIKREYDEGHTVALHTWSHNYSYIYRNMDAFFEDLYAVQNRVKEITGQTVYLMRFPGGSSNTVSTRYDGRAHIMSALTQEVEARGFSYYDWNVDSDDAGRARSADEVYENVINRLVWGGESVVLQHDVKSYSVEAVERIIQYGLENGFWFAKIEPISFTAHHGVNN